MSVPDTTVASSSVSGSVVNDSNAVATFAKLHPKEYHRKFFSHSLRSDGRTFHAIRSTMVSQDSINNCAGSALVKIGNTSVVCGIKMEIGKPFETKPTEGRLSVDVQLSPMCSPKFKVGRATEQAVALSQWLTNTIVNGQVFDLSDLSIVTGESAWVIYADIVCLNFDGNLYDACLLSLVQALKRTIIPETETMEDHGGNIITGSAAATTAGGKSGANKIGGKHAEVFISEVNFHKLKTNHTLIPTSFAILEANKNTEVILADYNGAEEELARAFITVVLNEKLQLCQIHKPGGLAVTDAQLQECIQQAKSRVSVVLPLFK